jgi:membrane protease YdiL (CAAX protease family)
MPNAEISIHIHGSILQALFESRFHDVVFEEVLYRGTLWMLLKELKLSDLQIIVVQTLAFWFSHYHYIGEPIKFWVYLPWVSLLLGVLVWRSKSISPSILVHFLYNVLMSLLRQSI